MKMMRIFIMSELDCVAGIYRRDLIAFTTSSNIAVVSRPVFVFSREQ